MPVPAGLGATLALLTFAAAPGEPPRWSTQAICEAMIAGAGASVESREGCRRSQDNALDELRRNWGSYPPDLAVRCTEEASLNGQRSYVDLVECINLGVLAAKDDPSLGAGTGGGPRRRP